MLVPLAQRLEKPPPFIVDNFSSYHISAQIVGARWRENHVFAASATQVYLLRPPTHIRLATTLIDTIALAPYALQTPASQRRHRFFLLLLQAILLSVGEEQQIEKQGNMLEVCIQRELDMLFATNAACVHIKALKYHLCFLGSLALFSSSSALFRTDRRFLPRAQTDYPTTLKMDNTKKSGKKKKRSPPQHEEG